MIRCIPVVIVLNALFVYLARSPYCGTQRAGIAAGGIFHNVQPRTAAQLKYKVEVNNKKPNRYSSAGTKVQPCKQPKFQRPAPLAAIPMLGVRCFSSVTVALYILGHNLRSIQYRIYL